MRFECPSCGERKHLRGERDAGAETVHIRCGLCGHDWVHDPWACPSCGGRMHAERKPLLQKARGTQQSIIGFNVVKRCPDCEPDEPKQPGWLSASLDTPD